MTPFEQGFIKQACMYGLTDHDAYCWLYKFATDVGMPGSVPPHVLQRLESARMNKFENTARNASGVASGSPLGSLGNVVNPTPVRGLDFGKKMLSHGVTSGGMSTMQPVVGPVRSSIITDVMGQQTPSAPYTGEILGAQHPQMPKPSLRGLAQNTGNSLMQHPERLLKGGLVGGATAAGLNAIAPTPENNGSYWHDVLNQVNDSTKSIVGGGTTGALLGGGVGAVPGAIGGGIYDLAQKAMTGGRDLWDTGKMKLDAGGQQAAIAALEEKLRAAGK